MQPPQAQPQQPEAPQKGGVQQLVEGIHTDLMKFMEVVQSANPQVAQKLEAVVQGFQQVVDALVGGAQPEPQPRGPSAGGPGAVPV